MYIGHCMPSDTSPNEDHHPRSADLRYARLEARLRDFIRTKQTTGDISDDHAREILSVNEELYRRHGVLRESGDQRALHSSGEWQELVAAQRQGYYLLERKLLELYPALTD